MPTVLIKNGWRLFFYMNERQEPPHIHATKGDEEYLYLRIDGRAYQIRWRDCSARLYAASSNERKVMQLSCIITVILNKYQVPYLHYIRIAGINIGCFASA